MSALTTRAASGRYYKTLGDTKPAPVVEKLCTRLESGQSTEIHTWLSALPMWREWVGDINAWRQKAQTLSVLNKKYEQSITIAQEDFRLDKTGQIMMQMDMLAANEPELWYDLLVSFLQNAGALYAYDGQFFWSASHSDGLSGTCKNLLTSSEVSALNVGTATAPTVAEMALAIMGVINYMQLMKDEQGRYMNRGAKEFVVLAAANAVGAAAQLAVTANRIDTGTGGSIDNPLMALQNKVTVEILPELSAYTDDFIVNRVDALVKPFIQQPQQGMKRFDVLGEGSEYAALHPDFLFSAKNAGAVAGGFWQYSAFATLV
jgi:phage major head subunit gpT-like protein